MQKINALDPATTTGKSKDLFKAIQGKLGMVPNMMRTMGNSPAVLNGYLSFSGALASSSVGAKLGELIALTVANANICDYCNAAHTFIGEKLVGIDATTLELAKEGRSDDAKTQSALTFAKTLVTKKGKVSDADINAVKNAGYDDAAIAEIIAHVALNIFTNYFNNTANTTVDFPKTRLATAA
ncbi:MAG TPA: peroxidase [Cytophagales bacterium]|jgi:uncharacterized peroxidase-related enzyme|nr:peroxidase [Cytophagales bacterium]